MVCPEFDGHEARLHLAAIAGVPDILCTLLWVVLKEMQFGGHAPEILADCGVRISSVLVVNHPDVRDDASSPVPEMREQAGVVP